LPYASIEDKRAYQREWIRKRKARAVDQLGGKCAQCGSRESLEFDHLDPLTKDQRLRHVGHNMWSWSETRRQSELEKCQLLCRRCHLIKSSEQSAQRERERRAQGTSNLYAGGWNRVSLN
jgi:5-methylcytosine-specific restriction endonuclease McrA